MPTIQAAAIISKAKILAADTGNVRWADSEWLGWLNDGQREIVILKPSAYTKIASVPLGAGTRQALPADGIEFIDYIRSMGVNGATPGPSARRVSRRLMDSHTPNWHSVTATATPQNYVYDPLAPKTFYVYPPATGTTQAEILYSALPPELPLLTSVISLDDIYQNTLLDYLLYRAYGKDDESIANAERSVLHRKAFETTLGLKAQADAAT